MTTVSYSGLSMYTQCPSSFQRKYLLKEKVLSEPTRESAPAMFRGTDIHNSIEDLLNGKREDVHKEIQKNYLGFCTELKEKGTQAELAFAFDTNWEPLTFDDPTAEIRGYMDAVLCTDDELVVYEWKTGKEYPEHANQRHLYGLAAMLMFPQHDKVRVIGTYLDQCKNVENSYLRSQLTTLKWTWTRKINKTKPPQPYPMRPSWKCRYCNYSKNQGGTCPN